LTEEEHSALRLSAIHTTPSFPGPNARNSSSSRPIPFKLPASHLPGVVVGGGGSIQLPADASSLPLPIESIHSRPVQQQPGLSGRPTPFDRKRRNETTNDNPSAKRRQLARTVRLPSPGPSQILQTLMGEPSQSHIDNFFRAMFDNSVSPPRESIVNDLFCNDSTSHSEDDSAEDLFHDIIDESGLAFSSEGDAPTEVATMERTISHTILPEASGPSGLSSPTSTTVDMPSSQWSHKQRVCEDSDSESPSASHFRDYEETRWSARRTIPTFARPTNPSGPPLERSLSELRHDIFGGSDSELSSEESSSSDSSEEDELKRSSTPTTGHSIPNSPKDIVTYVEKLNMGRGSPSQHEAADEIPDYPSPPLLMDVDTSKPATTSGTDLLLPSSTSSAITVAREPMRPASHHSLGDATVSAQVNTIHGETRTHTSTLPQSPPTRSPLSSTNMSSEALTSSIPSPVSPPPSFPSSSSSNTGLPTTSPQASPMNPHSCTLRPAPPWTTTGSTREEDVTTLRNALHDVERHANEYEQRRQEMTQRLMALEVDARTVAEARATEVEERLRTVEAQLETERQVFAQRLQEEEVKLQDALTKLSVADDHAIRSDAAASEAKRLLGTLQSELEEARNQAARYKGERDVALADVASMNRKWDGLRMWLDDTHSSRT
jgi:hypothetical protein